MGLDPVSTGLETVGAGLHLFDSILDRADRDGPDRKRDERITKVQNAFVSNDLDKQYELAYQLLTDAGHPPTPGGDVGEQEREFRHNFMLVCIELIHERELYKRALAKLVKA